MLKTKAQVNYAVTVTADKHLCFCFALKKFQTSSILDRPICVRPGPNPKGRFNVDIPKLRIIRVASCENRTFAFATAKTQISCAVTAQLISAFVFATQIVQNPLLQIPKILSCQSSSVTVQAGLCQI